MLPNTSKSIPPLNYNSTVFESDYDNANALNNFFRDQTLLDGSDGDIPVLQDIHGKWKSAP